MTIAAHSDVAAPSPSPDDGRRQRAFRGTRAVSRIGVLLAMITVTALTLTGVYVGARQLLITDIKERAATGVREQLDDFLTYAEDGTDPNTAGPFGSGTRLLDVYLSTRIPGPDESFAGVVGGRVIQMDRGESARRLEPGTAVTDEIVSSANAIGTIDEDDGSDIHWGKVHLSSAEDPRPAVFLVARYTDADHARLGEILDQLELLGLAGAGASIPVALVLALWLGRKRAVVTAPEPTGRAVSTQFDPTYSYRRALALTSREIDDQIGRLSPQLKEDPARGPHLGRLRQLSDSLTSLAAVLDPQSTDQRLRVDSGELTWQLVQRIRQDRGRPVRLASTATGHQVEVNPEQLRLALDEALRVFTVPGDTGQSTVEVGTAFHGEAGHQVLSLWIRRLGDGGPGTPGRFAGSVPPVMQAVADLHDGRAWAEDGNALGDLLGIDVPVHRAADT